MKKYFFEAIIIIIVISVLLFAKNRSQLNLPEAQASETVELKNGQTFNLTAGFVKKNINGNDLKMLAYNGSIPGPLIKVAQGSEVTINFKNDTDVKTLLHSHGVRMDNPFDGSQTTQEEMEAGETFAYKLKFPDAGMYWYHPHVREDYTQELGLYGNFLVVPASTDYWSQVNQEVAFFVDDIYLERGILPFNKQQANRTLMGRFGNVMLVNGLTDYKLGVKQGEVIRFYFTNAANTRTFNLTIPNTKMKLVGSDGGKYEKEAYVDSVVISPSERAVVEILFDKTGSYTFQHKTPEKTYSLGTITVAGNANQSFATIFQTLRTNKDVTATIDPLRSMFNRNPDKSLELSVDMMGMGRMMGHDMGSMMMGNAEKIEWEDDMAMMNTMSNAGNVKWKMIETSSGKENMDIDWNFKAGDKVKIKIFDDPNSAHPMQHPIHIHGQRFLVLNTNGTANTNLVWKDTVLVQNGDSVELLVDMSNPGTWMAHCHIAEHLEAGMMMKFKVE